MTIGRIPSVEGGIQPTIVDAKGDLIAAVAADSVNRLAVGSNDQVLVADSAASTGLAWKSYGAQFVAGKNKIINGDFSINQRAFTSTTTDTAFGFDRWYMLNVGGITTYSTQTFTPGSAPVAGYEAANFARIATASQVGSTNYSILNQRIEDVRTLAGQTFTISFWAKAASGTPKVAVELSQRFGSGGSPSATVDNYIGNVTLSTSWARYSITGTLPSISGKTIGTTANSSFVQLLLWTSAGSDFNSRTGSIGIQNNTIDFWGVQLEAGSVATPFTTATGTIQGELAACQRYYWRANVTSGAYLSFAVGQNYSTTQALIHIPNPVAMRTGAASVDYANLGLTNSSATPQALTAFTLNHTGPLGNALAGTVASGLVAGNATILSANNSTAAYVAFSAEL